MNAKAFKVGPQYALRDTEFTFGSHVGRYLLNSTIQHPPAQQDARFWNGHPLRLQKNGHRLRGTTKPLPPGAKKKAEADAA